MNMTQMQVANKANIDRTHYTNIELGKKNPSYSLSLKLKEALKYFEDDLFLNFECQKGTKAS